MYKSPHYERVFKNGCKNHRLGRLTDQYQFKYHLSLIYIIFIIFLNYDHIYASSINIAPMVYASFDDSISVDQPGSITCVNSGGRILKDGLIGGALQLNAKEWIKLELEDSILQREGAILFWIRPHWSNTAEDSHTFLSFTWQDRKDGYFVLSDGWWEHSGGKPFTYYIFNNQDKIKLQKRVFYQKQRWKFIACTWKSGTDGYIKLFTDGILHSEVKKKNLIIYPLKNEIHLGSDHGSTLFKNRFADADFDEFRIYNKALNESQIWDIYEKESLIIYSSQNTVPQKETRVIFDETADWVTKINANTIISRIKSAGFNVLIPCVWHGRGVRFPSVYAPPEKGLVFEKDPLKRLINIAHGNNIEVHPWFTIALRQRNFFKSYYDFGTPKKAFNVHNAEFRSFIVNLVLDVVKRYEIDGINLDYIRTMGICTSDLCIADYYKIYGRNLLKDLQGYSQKRPLPETVQEWQDNAIRDIVSKISMGAKMIKPNLVVSVDGHPRPEFLFPSAQGRREIKWVNDGLVDVIYSMDYKRNPNFEIHQFAIKELDNPYKLIPIVGNYEKEGDQVSSRNADLLVRLLKRSRQLNNTSSAVYWYPSLDEAQILSIRNDVFHSDTIPY